MNMLVLFGLLMVLLTIGMPVGFAIGAATIITMYTLTNLDLVLVAQHSFAGINSFTLLAIPFFMLAGTIMSRGGIAKRIVDFADSLVGFVTGALGAISLLACMFFGTLSGSGMATTSAIGSMMIPEMSKNGYDRAYAATLTAYGGITGPVLPPSLALVIYGSVTGTSIAKLFIAGIIPGIMLIFFLIAANYYICKKYKFGIVEKKPERQIRISEMIVKRVLNVLRTLKNGFWALLSPVIILGGIYAGIFTPTEAACVSVVYSLIISVCVYKELKLKELWDTFLDTSVLNGVTSFLLAYSTVFAVFFTHANLPSIIREFLSDFAPNKFVMLLFINLIVLSIGLFLDLIPATIILAPILLPSAVSFGVSPVHFGVIIALNLGIGLCTPPYGCNLFVGAAVGNTKVDLMFKYMWPLLISMLLCLMLVTFIPALSLVLVK